MVRVPIESHLEKVVGPVFEFFKGRSGFLRSQGLKRIWKPCVYGILRLNIFQVHCVREVKVRVNGQTTKNRCALKDSPSYHKAYVCTLSHLAAKRAR